jgi:hypothetical protein
MSSFCFGRAGLPISLFTLLLLAAVASADSAGLAGNWVANAVNSQAADFKLSSLTIQQVNDNWKIASVARKGDAAVKTEFTCTTNGKDCEFGDSGHKGKVSMWYNGPALLILLTEGAAGDVVFQWKLEASADHKTLTLTLSHILPGGNDETLAFDKSAT